MPKDWLVSGAVKPRGWPVTWQFPRSHAWPPLWPKRLRSCGGVVLHSSYIGGTLTVWCEDKRGCCTEILVGEYLRVLAGTDRGAVLLRERGKEEWAEGALLLVETMADGRVGVVAEIEVDESGADGHRVQLEVSVYGVLNGPVAVA